VAAAMFGMDDGQASEADVHDAIGEIANMTAGNVKGLVSGYSRLSLPTVTEGTRLSISMPGSRVVRRAAFDCGQDSFSVIVLEKA
jgi:CheY-specific phosphatase CheX